MTARPAGAPLVSAIVPAYNAAETIADAIESIRAQTYPHTEIVICNDGSTDNTAEVVRALCPEAVYLEQPNAGPAAARNAAAAAASGEFLAPLDADDRWTPEKLEHQLEIIADDPGIGAVCTNGIVVSGGHSYPWISVRGPRVRELSVAEQLRTDRRPISASMLCRTDVFRALGGYDEAIVWGEDLDFFCRMVASGHRLLALRDPLYIYVRASGSITAGSGLLRHAADALRVVEKMDPRIEHEGYRSPLTLREFSDALGERLLRLVWAHDRVGDGSEARRLMGRVAELPAPRPILRVMAATAARSWPLFTRLLTIERRLRHVRHFVGRWGLIGGIRRHLAGHA